jgi:hypothetical protein
MESKGVSHSSDFYPGPRGNFLIPGDPHDRDTYPGHDIQNGILKPPGQGKGDRLKNIGQRPVVGEDEGRAAAMISAADAEVAVGTKIFLHLKGVSPGTDRARGRTYMNHCLYIFRGI